MDRVIKEHSRAEVKLILQKVRRIVSKSWNWTQAVGARDVNSQPVEAYSKEAVCWCVTGAFERATKDGEGNRNVSRDAAGGAWGFLNYANERHNGFDRLYEFNDRLDTTHKDIMNFLDSVLEDLPKWKELEDDRSIKWSY